VFQLFFHPTNEEKYMSLKVRTMWVCLWKADFQLTVAAPVVSINPTSSLQCSLGYSSRKEALEICLSVYPATLVPVQSCWWGCSRGYCWRRDCEAL